MNDLNQIYYRRINAIMDELTKAKIKLEMDEEFSPHVDDALGMLEDLHMDT